MKTYDVNITAVRFVVVLERILYARIQKRFFVRYKIFKVRKHRARRERKRDDKRKNNKHGHFSRAARYRYARLARFCG